MPLDLKTISHIVLDIGGVILNIDEQKSFDAFRLLGCSEDQLRSILEADELFHRFEKGLIAPETFRASVIRSTGTAIPDREFDMAWNAMLLDIPVERAACIEQLSHRFKLHVLSNTNAIHLEAFREYCHNTFHLMAFDGWFRHGFYSNELHRRKPEAAIFKHVTGVLNSAPESILFVDDTAANTEMAKQFGWQCILLDGAQEFRLLFCE